MVTEQGQIRAECECGLSFTPRDYITVRLNLETIELLLPCCSDCGLVRIKKDYIIGGDLPLGLIQKRFVCGHADEFKDKLDGVPYILWKADPNEIGECWRGMCPKFNVETDPRGRYASVDVAAHILSQEVRKKLGETITCDICEKEESEVFRCKKCSRNLCDECWGTISHEVTPAVMYDRNMEGSPAEYDKTMCDGCYRLEGERE